MPTMSVLSPLLKVRSSMLLMVTRSHFWRCKNETDRAWQPLPPNVNKAWRRNERFNRRRVAENKFVPTQFTKYDEQFEKVVDLQQQLKALETRGFLRTYNEYTPPPELASIFASACQRSKLTEQSLKELDMHKIILDFDQKAQLLSILADLLKHRVPNSLLHTLNTLADVYAFYDSKVDASTPYERLHQQMKKGELPSNLHVLEEAIVFDGNSNHPMGKTTAYPRMSSFPRTPEEAKKRSFYQSEHSPWFMGPEDVDEHKEFYHEK